LIQEVADPIHFKTWIQQCESLHGDKCASPVWLQNAKMPLGLKVFDVREICICDASPDCRYFALSYVWGDTVSRNAIQSTRNNIASRKMKGGLNANFPLVIQDAIELVQSLGERYLWVDAICINQDDELERGAIGPVLSGISSKVT
jgi:hypothetical protein